MFDDTDNLPMPNFAIYDGDFSELAEAIERPVGETKKAFLRLEEKGLVGRLPDPRMREEFVRVLAHRNSTPLLGAEEAIWEFLTSDRPTEHPHIVRNAQICGGNPRIKGTRITVRLIANYYKEGFTVEDVLQDQSHLNHAQVFDALSYYFDHPDLIEREIEENKIENIMRKYRLKSKDGFLVPEEVRNELIKLDDYAVAQP
jgi:uncharacterized protein (DUF433 family)